MDKKGCPVVFVSILLVGFGSAFAQMEETGDQVNKFVIGSIQTAGNRGVSTAEILSKVRSRVGQQFDPAGAAEDARRIARLRGVQYSYYNTAVVDNKIQLTFVVVERNIVRSISFFGNRKYKAKTLRKKLGVKLADYLDPIIAETGRETLAEFYRGKGYAFVDVSLDSGQLSYGKLIYKIDEGPRVKIKSVGFSGNNSVKTSALKRVIKTSEREFLLWPKYYKEDRLSIDVIKLQNVYQKRGFLDSSITVERQFAKDKSGIRLAFVVDEGPVYTVQEIVITGNEHFGDRQLRDKLTSQRGQVYSDAKAVSDAKGLLKLYSEQGFIDVMVKHKRQFVSKNTVKVAFEITEGERFRIGRIDITGNEQTQDKVVRRILDEYEFQPGQWYNADIARADGSGELEKKIQRMILTERGGATITPSGQAPGRRDAQVSVIEGQTGSVMLGAGVASDSGVIGQLVFEQRNFDISDRPKSFGDFITGRAFKGAGQNLRIALQPGTEVSEYLVSFSEPYFQNKPVTLDVTGSSYERWRESYDEERLKGRVGFEKRFRNRWRRSIGFRLENVDVGDLDRDAPKEIISVRGDNALVGVRVGIGRDLTDDIFNPTRGYNFDAAYEQVGGDHTFGILSGIYRRYRTLHVDLAERKTVLATKLLAATVLADAPPFEKFYAGGSGLYGIRGFDYRGVSTRGLQTSVAKPERKDPIGSDWIFLANAEVTVPLVSENFAILFFVDSGAIDSGNYRLAAGTGIQILIPQWFGPVPMRFELAAPLMKDDDDDTQVFSFSVGKLF